MTPDFRFSLAFPYERFKAVLKVYDISKEEDIPDICYEVPPQLPPSVNSRSP